MMIRAAILICSLSLGFAALKNTAPFRDTILKYYVGQQDTTIFAGAILSCHYKGGRLVMPKDKNFNQAVANVAMKQRAWIGGSDIFGENAYRWNDDTNVEWANWASGQPDNFQNQDCAVINCYGFARWDDGNCGLYFGYVCQIPDNRALASETSKYTVYNGWNVTSNFNAKEFCRTRRSRLALLENDDQLKNLVSELDDTGFAEYWVDRQDDGGSCSTVSGYGVTNADCFEELPFICEQVAPYGLRVSEEETSLEAGSDFDVRCTASGIPVPAVKWYREGVYVSHQKRGMGQSTLVLKNVSSEDAGMYVCKAVNNVGNERRAMEGYSFIEITNIL